MRRSRVLLATGAAVALAACTSGSDPDPAQDPAGSSASAPAASDEGGDDDEEPATTSEATEAPADDAADATARDTGDTPSAAAAIPALDVEVVMEGLDIPWDVQPLPDGTVLVTERGGRLLAHEDGQTREVALDIPDLFVGSESGLMGMALSPDVAQDGTIYLCHATAEGGAPADLRVTRWVLDEEVSTAEMDGVVVADLPITSGRHGGCRLLLHEDVLYVGTGDAADEANPQSLDSLGGKVLALDPDGGPVAEAPFVDGDPRILTYGHRNVQGLAVQPGSGDATLWSVEHGSDRDDEVNVLEPGANYGWDPGPGYDESVPMTDLEAFPDAVEAAWSSGEPTHATSGAVFLEGEQWGAWDGGLAVAELRGTGVTVFTVAGEQVTDEQRMAELDGSHGRLRSLTLDADGALWVTTSNGGTDQVLKVTPQG